MNPYLSIVNQKIFFCNLLLQQGKLSELGLPKLEDALCQSALYQLECAYSFYLREIAATYQYKEAENVSSAQTLAAALNSMNKHPAEAQEIISLLEREDSWLAQMLSAHRQLSLLPEQSVSADPASPLALKDITQLHESVSLNYEQLSNWHASLIEMTDRHREMMVEC
jgi:hypothetical protein